MKDLKAMFGKKSKDVDPVKKEAKLNALKGLRSMATDMGGDDVKRGMSKVTVAADDKEDLKKGLDKAKELVESPELEAAEEATGMDLDNDQEAGESEDHQEKVLEACNDPEEIDEMIRKLQEKKQSLSDKK